MDCGACLPAGRLDAAKPAQHLVMPVTLEDLRRFAAARFRLPP